jgi:hypothetical protein
MEIVDDKRPSGITQPYWGSCFEQYQQVMNGLFQEEQGWEDAALLGLVRRD